MQAVAKLEPWAGRRLRDIIRGCFDRAFDKSSGFDGDMGPLVQDVTDEVERFFATEIVPAIGEAAMRAMRIEIVRILS